MIRFQLALRGLEIQLRSPEKNKYVLSFRIRRWRWQVTAEKIQEDA